MSSKLNGTWILEKTENFEEFMKEYGKAFFFNIKIVHGSL